MTAGAEAPAPNDDRVKVVVRVRPASLEEKCGAYKSMVRVVDGNMLVFDPDTTEDGRVLNSIPRRVGLRRAKNLRYAYDHVFDADTGQSVIFERTTRPLIAFACAGYQATVFAYGATGSGKVNRAPFHAVCVIFALTAD